MFSTKSSDGRVTAPGVQRDQQIVLFVAVLLSD